MASEPINKAKSSCHSKNQEETNVKKKLTVLESHGYILGKTVGVGTYATVKLADSNRHRCQVAVKVISKFQAPSANLNKFLPREIQVVKNLRHPNLIRYFQAIETSYRDIKCENLLLDRQYNLKLSDFGFARGYMKPVDGVQSLCETYCGSFAYASPEIICSIPYRPQLSDIWSAGVVLYTMVFGRLPFDDTSWSKLRKQVQSKVVFPKSPKVSRACRSLILRILVPQNLRPSIAEIQKDAWLTKQTATAQTSTDDARIEESTSTVKSHSGKTLSNANTSAKSRKSSHSKKSDNNEE
ncbi:testis-specific serine/threonine-protein kinase 4-like [Phymastichus coffea]|uniref:testis-specific serine/threonine-protein kinase 4-like n=1 Tax=Phymastichus coffea TaxID=108790 RepID=UPI00273C3BB0|nr:testis-specific serine/threonine-protein kinase 4-like [Phymastichus coffea]